VKVGDLVVYNPETARRMAGGRWQGMSSEDYGVGIVLDENPYYYFVNWSNVSDSMLAISKDQLVHATVENVQQLRELAKRKKELDKWAVI
tara:strand:- start:259 stop:528 length:270 start_codon:yes stop_codon:yes gene_type:complete